MDGRLELVAAATEGEIRGFMPSNPETRSKVFDLTSEQEAIRELTQKKANLLLELKNYEENARLAPAGPGVLLAASKANATGNFHLFKKKTRSIKQIFEPKLGARISSAQISDYGSQITNLRI